MACPLLQVSGGFIWSTCSFLVHVETGLLCSDPIPVSLLTLGLLPRCHLPPPWRMHVLSFKASTICMLLPRTSGNSMEPVREKITEKYLQGFAHFQITSGLFQLFIKQQVINLTKTLVSICILQSQNWSSRFSWKTMGNDQDTCWSQLNFCSLSGAFLVFSSTSTEFPAANTSLSLLSSTMSLDKKWAEDNICLFKKKKKKEPRIFNWAVIMKIANGAKAKERVSENDCGKKW